MFDKSIPLETSACSDFAVEELDHRPCLLGYDMVRKTTSRKAVATCTRFRPPISCKDGNDMAFRDECQSHIAKAERYLAGDRAFSVLSANK